MFITQNKQYRTYFMAIFAVIVFLIYFLITNNQPLPVVQEGLLGDTNYAVQLTESSPVKLRIPTLSIETSFVEPLGLLPDGEIEVPDSYTEVGWYKFGPTPGELGPAVILGHVDSYQGPAVFFSLGQLKVGDQVFVDREDGTTAVFEVTELERPRQATFPTARVYGDIDHAGLRLITCSGLFVRGTQRYTHNLIVYARLVE